MRLLLALLLLPMSCFAADVEWRAIVLLQPEVSIREKNPDVQAVSNYIKAAQSAAAGRIAQEELPKSSGYIVFAVRQGGLSNAWLDFSPAMPTDMEQQILAAVRGVEPFRVDQGTLVFAVRASINGAPDPASPMPFPAAWREATEGSDEPIEVEALVGRVWP